MGELIWGIEYIYYGGVPDICTDVHNYARADLKLSFKSREVFRNHI